jgi:opacity protein-like surface antigen
MHTREQGRTAKLSLVFCLMLSPLLSLPPVQAQPLTDDEIAAERARQAERVREAERAPDAEESRELQRIREEERARGAAGSTTEAQRIREEERARAMEQASMERRYEERRYDDRRPGEFYVAGFGGYTFGHNFSNPQGLGSLSGATFGGTGIDIGNSGVYGVKAGYFLPDRWNWLGFEVEGFNTTPHIKQHPESVGESVSEGSHLRVTTLAFNVIARGKFACRSRGYEYERDYDSGRGIRTEYRDHEFCPLQPYVGVGLGVFFARAKDADGSDSDNGVPGLNALAGIRYFFTEHVALFGEYKYNRATFTFDTIDSGNGAVGGFKGTYSASMVVGGLSFHF